MNCIIVDDDILVHKILTSYINKTVGCNLLATYNSPVDLINDNELNWNVVDLIFLDVEMPEMTGLDFLEMAKKEVAVVIVSAKEQYALPAYSFNVADYLLKPVDYGRFFKAVKKVDKLLNSYNTVHSDGFFYKAGNSTLKKMKFEEIVYLEALENYIVFYLSDGKKVYLRQTMVSIERQLPKDIFVRVHRSYIINLRYIDSIVKNNVVMQVADGYEKIIVSKAYKDTLMKKINIIKG